jgi:DNA-binding PadR family transcriptional regulator
MGTAKKTNVINLHLVDFSSGMDIIRRLVSQGFITESVDNTDKRAKALQITKEGEKILEAATQKINEEKNMFFSGIQENKWRKLLPVLEEINDFHNHIYLNHNEKNDAELMNLVASLKYLHK